MVFEREQAEKHCSYPSPRVCPNGTQLKKTKVTKQCFKITLHIRIIRFLLNWVFEIENIALETLCSTTLVRVELKLKSSMQKKK